MQLTLFKGNVINSFVLPEKCSGQYWVNQTNENGDKERVISVDGVEGKWILKSNKYAVVKNQDEQEVKEIVIEPLCFYNINLLKTNEDVLLYCEPITDDRKYYEKLILPEEGKLVIGSSPECDISYSNPFIYIRHAEIYIKHNEILINDLSNSNGIFVNELKVNSKVLATGDVVYIMGLKIIIGKGFIAINNPDGKVHYNKSILKKFVKQQAEVFDDEQCIDDGEMAGDLFYRSPRFRRDIEKAKIKIDPPTTPEKIEETPLALMVGPAITMGFASLFTGLLSLQNVINSKGNLMTAAPTLMMSLSMLLGTVLWPILTRRYEKRKRKKREKLRQSKYKEYLNNVRQNILNECLYQSQILNENFVDIDKCVSKIELRERNLWERTIEQSDFLQVRVGIGNIPLQAEIAYPEKKFSIDEDNLMQELYKLSDEPKTLMQVPITLSLVENPIVGIIGNRDIVLSFVKELIFQLASLHSYDELKFVFLYDQKEQYDWNFTKWLPHVWNDENTIRFIAVNQNEVKELSAFIEKEIQRRENIDSEEELKEICPYYIIFAIDKDIAGKAEMVNMILKHKKNYGFSIITLYNELNNLPKECQKVLDINPNIAKMYDKNDITGKYIAFHPDTFKDYNANELAVSLANIQLDTSANTYTLPNMLTFLQMFGVSKIEHLNVLTRWKENDPTMTLETPIGVDGTGDIFKLDLHEKFHGPHGLVAGMTGSGKSEFIMTFILSLAVNYHPDEVAFILIDYKGGGMANTFENLPHVAGTITNLDGAAVKRSLISIQSELKRRQAIFSETSKKVNVSNIDIYKYQKLYRDGVVKEPLQHLFIISDEFAELKMQQPEFMEQLVSAARIGRSLGVHLILATQKPSGVVDDQIWSNSKFRICLKVQEKADSMDVIKRPDAAELSVTGRFYVQVGFNELFLLGQSAWCGAPYYPSERVEKERDDSVTVIDRLGRVVKQVKEDKNAKKFSNPPKQIDEIVKYLSKFAKEENINIRKLWLEPIPELIYIDDLKKKYGYKNPSKHILDPVIGEIDDPANQRQLIMTMPITKEGNAAIYGAAGSGKTTLLTSLVYSLISNHTSEELNIYILDFGSETLRAFSKAPHVGDVLLSNEVEKVTNLFKMMNKEIEKRKKLFSDYGGDYQSYIKASKVSIEAIVIVIHNYSAFTEIYGEEEETIAYLTREGVKYGIYFVVTALNTGAIRYRVLQNFKQIFVLQLNDQSDYSGVLGNVDGVYPTKCKGRGIFKSDKVYEFQTAHISQKAENTFEFVKNYCNEYAKNNSYAPAKKIPILPARVDTDYLESEIRSGHDNRIPIGVEKNRLNVAYYNFDSSYINLVLSQNGSIRFIQGLAEVMASKGLSDIIVLDPDGTFEMDEGKKYKYIHEEDELNDAVVYLFNSLVHRNNVYKEAKDQGDELPVYDKVTCIISSLSSLLTRISDDSKDKLSAFLEKGEIEYNFNFIIADNISNISAITYENWFKSKVSLSDGIWVGNGITDQYQFKTTNVTADLYQEIGDDFGYTINNGKVTLIKLLSSTVNNEEVGFNG